MSRRLITTFEAIFHLKLELGDTLPPDLELNIDAASEGVLDYLGDDATFLADGDVVLEDVPAQVKKAVLIWVAIMDWDREGADAVPDGYPPPAVRNMLYPLRAPRMA